VPFTNHKLFFDFVLRVTINLLPVLVPQPYSKSNHCFDPLYSGHFTFSHSS